MKRAHFVAPARAELLAEVAYYNHKELGLGSRFLAVVEDATARALAYPLTGSPASEILGECSSRTSLLRLCIDRMKME